MGKDELRNALDHAAGHGPEVDFTGTWGAGRRMRRRRQAAQGLGGLVLAASLVGAFALGGGDLLSRDSLGPATPAPTTAEPTIDPTTAEPTGTAAPTSSDPTTDPGSDLIILPNPCDEPTTGLTVMGTPDATAATMEHAQELLDLASSCDLDGLIALATEQSTTLSFGNTSPEDAFAGEQGRERVHVLASLLVNYPPELGAGNDGPLLSAQWPFLEQDQWPELIELGIASQEDVDLWDANGGYTGWRIWIEDDGLWSGMLAGD